MADIEILNEYKSEVSRRIDPARRPLHAPFEISSAETIRAISWLSLYRDTGRSRMGRSFRVTRRLEPGPPWACSPNICTAGVRSDD